MKNQKKIIFYILFVFLTAAACRQEIDRPNILFCISDDQSWAHTSFAGAKEIETPAFDRIAETGIYFENAYTAVPSCAPSRAAILTGQDIYRLKEGGLLFGALSREFPVFTELLKDAGYEIAYTGKGYAPAKKDKEGYYQNPLGRQYDSLKLKAPPGVLNTDYAGNFQLFLEQNKEQPFFFWYGSKEPHRNYSEGIGAENGKNLNRIEVPKFLPDAPEIRKDFADYYFEIEWFDQHLQRMITLLEEKGELENTLIVVVSDNGKPFPRAKATLYEYGTHMPMAVSWPAKISAGRKVADFISFTDLAPTFLELAGVEPSPQMTGRSFTDILYSGKSGWVDSSRNQVVTAIERHTYARRGGLPYPSRAIRKGDWVYIRNFEPDRWPAGAPDFKSPHQGVYGDVDRGLSRTYMLENKDSEKTEPYFELAFGKRPAEELYNLQEDPFQLRNLADEDSLKNQLDQLKNALTNYLQETNDPRMSGESPWDNYPYYFQDFTERSKLPVSERDTLINGLLQ